MVWYKFWAKGKDGGKKDASKSVDNQLLEVDFFCHLSYMAAIATSGISRSGLFEYAAKMPYISASYFKRAVFVAKAFNHDYAEACRIVGQNTQEPDVKAFLLRMSGALSSGEDIVTFLQREADVSSDAYGNQYERRLETLRKWTDAYVALIMTTAVVTIVSVVSMMIGNVTTVFVVGMSSLTIVVTIAGVWLIYHSAPRESKVHSLSIRSKEQNLARNMVRLTLPVVVVVAALMLVMKIDLGYVMIAVAIFIFPLGLIGKIDDGKIDKRDSEVAGLLRSLGGVSQAIGSTVNEAMARLDFHSLGSLKENVNLLYTRILAGIDPRLCWDQFVGETGSEQVNRSVRTFLDGVLLGGEPELVGNSASGFAMKITLLRAKRKLIESGMLWLAVVMHMVLSILVVFVYQVLVSFTALIADVMPGDTGVDAIAAAGIPAFGLYGGASTELDLLHFMVITIVLVLAFANATAIYATSGGHIYKIFFYLTLTLGASGFAVILGPPVVRMMFSGMG